MKRLKQIIPPALLFLSLFFLRHQLMLELKLSYSEALGFDLYLGWIYDFAGVLIVAVVCQFFWGVLLLPQKILWTLCASVLWLTTLANVLHYSFFKSMLEWWVVKFHWQDLTVVADSSAGLASTPYVLASMICFLASIFLVCSPFFSFATLSRSRVKTSILAVVSLVLIYQVANYAVWHEYAKANVLNEQILKVWNQEWQGNFHHFVKEEVEKNAKKGQTLDIQIPTHFLRRYQNYTEAPSQAAEASSSKLNAPGLAYDFASNPKLTAKLRQQFGFPLEGPLNVIVLFVESWRIFEVEHPEIGLHVFPKLRAILHQKSIYFPQAYSASLTAGQTVRGQFSTLCSALPNITGPAVYRAYPYLKVRCLPQLFQESGYRTLWMNSFFSSFHNKEIFESFHGTQEFYDQNYFAAQGITEKIGNWGLADHLFLDESLKLLESLKQPFFANLLTISTHEPFFYIPQGELPPNLVEQMGEHADYLGYLSVFRYADEALSHFVETFLASPLAERTLLVMLGDHSFPLEPPLELSPLQRKELQFRIPIALISKHLKNPQRITKPVHQMDVAPTIARMVGLSGEVTWLGKGLFSGEGSPWIYQDKQGFYYRTASRGCYQQAGNQSEMSCWKTPHQQDLLFSGNLRLPDFPQTPIDQKPVPEIPEQTQFFKNVVENNKQAITFNQMMPGNSD